MANDDFPRGLFPLDLKWGEGVHYYKAATAGDIFLYTPVALTANGVVAPVDVASAGAVRILGTVVGFTDGAPGGGNSPGGGLATDDPYLDVSDLGSNPEPYVAVADDPMQLFVLQEDTGGSALTQAAIGTVGQGVWRTAGSGNTTTGYAQLEFDRSTIVTTKSGQFMLLGIMDVRNTDGTINTTGNYCKLIVRIMHHQRGDGAGEIGPQV